MRNAKGQDPLLVGFNAALTLGTSLIGNAIGFHKWWPSSLTLSWRRPSEKEKEEIYNFYQNKNKEWERIEQDPTTKQWYVWRRPVDYDLDDPNDDRWLKLPI